MPLHLPWPTVARIGRGFCRAIKAFPPLFLIVVALGLSVGVCLAFYAPAQSLVELVFLRLIGYSCLIFYGALLWLFVSRQIAGTWNQACDYGISVFDDAAEWRADLVRGHQVDAHPVDTGIEIQRVWDLFGIKRGIQVIVDGVDIGQVRFGANRRLAVSPGAHEVWVEMDFCKSTPIKIDVQPGELVHLRCGGRFRFLFPLSMVGMIIWPGSFFFLEVVPSDEFR